MAIFAKLHIERAYPMLDSIRVGVPGHVPHHLGDKFVCFCRGSRPKTPRRAGALRLLLKFLPFKLGIKAADRVLGLLQFVMFKKSQFNHGQTKVILKLGTNALISVGHKCPP